MGKIRKTKVKTYRHLPLSQQLHDDSYAKATGRTKLRSRSEEINVVDDKLTEKIIQNAIKQQDELQEEYGSNRKQQEHQVTILSDDRQKNASDSESESDNEDKYDNCDPVQINEEDEKAVEMFMNKHSAVRKTLADIIREKINEKHIEILTQISDGQPTIVDLEPKVVEMYRGVRLILSKYRSGKLPKAFKIIPSLSNWEQILAITDPSCWTAAAMYQATRIFASNLKERMAQRFFNLVLLPRIRDDIFEFKRLNFHLYQALRKSLFKPGAFFKGILLPLCEAGDCTLQEAIIIGSVISKNSIPVLHSSAAMLKIAEMDYNGANSIFLRILFDKKYALPYRVIDAVIHHFLRFETDKRELPVLWHQSLLVFVQRYKEDISSEQKARLQELVKIHCHYSISPEIRRELQNSKCHDREINDMCI